VVAGKTGTCSRLGWFASYTPADNPSLVLVVFLPRGSGHGASAVAGRIYQELFQRPAAGGAPTAAGAFE
jgi:cell division protein FtsI/penicillin-binding protein 2